MTIRLYGYWRSSAAYRVRIGLALKGLAYDYAAVNLLANEQNAPDYRARQPQGLVPMLDTGDGGQITQSLAILEWLDETYPAAPLLPKAPGDKAIVRAMAYAVACDIHPINNLRVLKHVRKTFGADDATIAGWQTHWIALGFEAQERLIEAHGGAWSFGDAPTLADVCLVPQVVNSTRVNMDLSLYPRLAAIFERAKAHPAFVAAAPENQPDAVKA
jgi:maleylpyruvate isomerase